MGTVTGSVRIITNSLQAHLWQEWTCTRFAIVLPDPVFVYVYITANYSLTTAVQTFSTPAAINVQYEFVEVDPAQTAKDATRTKLFSLRVE